MPTGTLKPNQTDSIKYLFVYFSTVYCVAGYFVPTDIRADGQFSVGTPDPASASQVCWLR